MYLLTGAADLIRRDDGTNYEQLNTALNRLWNNMVDSKMYATGGIGAIAQWEGFGLNYFLPQGTDEGGCYAETCAAIGIMMFAERLLQVWMILNAWLPRVTNADMHKLSLDGRYTDIMELALYNAMLTSMSHDGQRFTYNNQLASSDQDASRREDWFTCACCPPNVLRVLGQIGGYIWSHNDDVQKQATEIIVHLFVPATLKYRVGDHDVELKQSGNWPWESKVKFDLQSSGIKTTLKVRIPGWAKSYKVRTNLPKFRWLLS